MILLVTYSLKTHNIICMCHSSLTVTIQSFLFKVDKKTTNRLDFSTTRLKPNLIYIFLVKVYHFTSHFVMFLDYLFILDINTGTCITVDTSGNRSMIIYFHITVLIMCQLKLHDISHSLVVYSLIC